MKKRARITAILMVMILTMGACSGASDEEPKESQSSESVDGKEDSTATTEPQQTVSDIPENYVSAIVVTINPQIKLYLDANDVTVAVEFLNEDAKDAYGSLEFVGKTIEKCVEDIVTEAIEQKYLESGENVAVTVVEVKDENVSKEELCSNCYTAVEEVLVEKEITATVNVEVATTVAESQGSSGNETTTVAGGSESSSSLDSQNTSETTTDETTSTEEVATTEEQTETTTVATTPCKTCGGTGKCQECKGDGYLGSGYTVACPRCKGSLTETCIYCDSNGNSNKHEGKCDFPNCMGSHVYACTTCGGGTRAVTCASCGGDGKCKSCGGSGQK